jgi:signal transduction histidine kinase
MSHEQSLFFVFFIYGLAFFAMGLAMTMESWRGSALAPGPTLLSLAGFGLIHGAHEWLESYLIQAVALGVSLPGWLPWLRLGMLAASFTSLLIFGLQALRLVERPLPRDFTFINWILAAYLAAIVLSAFLTYQHTQVPWQNVIDALARYLLAVTASILAALGLRARSLQARATSPNLASSLNAASIGFGLYALTQLFVHPIAMFPADVINEESFRALAGFPIQGVRTAMATVITIALMRAAWHVERLRREELSAAQQARLDALEQQQQIRRDLLRHIVRAQEEERARIARELHDETSQTLTAFSLELALLKTNLPRRSVSNQTVERLLDLSRQMSQGIYRLITGLRPSHIDELGVTRAIQALVDRDYVPKGFTFGVDVRGEVRRLDSIVETALFRVAQEALTNVARHSGVREGRVEISFEADRVCLRVSDRGRGFNPEEPFHPPRGWGIEGMRERVEAVDGMLRIDSAREHGTMIEAMIPVTPGKEEA